MQKSLLSSAAEPYWAISWAAILVWCLRIVGGGPGLAIPILEYSKTTCTFLPCTPGRRQDIDYRADGYWKGEVEVLT